jgi:YHS domain-containing protein
MLIWLLRLVVVYLVLRGISRLVQGIGEGLRAPRDAQKPAVPLVRDPICGTFVVSSRALTSGSGGDMRFFCSERCRRAYISSSSSTSAAASRVASRGERSDRP